MERMIKKLVVETESGSIYEISRENGSKQSGILIKKQETDKCYWLVLVGNIGTFNKKNSLRPANAPIPTNLFYSESKGLLPDLIDDYPDKLKGNKLFYYDKIRDFQTMQTMFMESTKENVKSGAKPSLPENLVESLGNTTRVVNILEKIYFF